LAISGESSDAIIVSAAANRGIDARHKTALKNAAIRKFIFTFKSLFFEGLNSVD